MFVEKHSRSHSEAIKNADWISKIVPERLLFFTWYLQLQRKRALAKVDLCYDSLKVLWVHSWQTEVVIYTGRLWVSALVPHTGECPFCILRKQPNTSISSHPKLRLFSSFSVQLLHWKNQLFAILKSQFCNYCLDNLLMDALVISMYCATGVSLIPGNVPLRRSSQYPESSHNIYKYKQKTLLRLYLVHCTCRSAGWEKLLAKELFLPRELISGRDKIALQPSHDTGPEKSSCSLVYRTVDF